MFGLKDLKYLFKRSVDDSKIAYRQDFDNNKRVIERISLYNKGFSETIFTSWVSNIFLRYILYCSNTTMKEKLEVFESIHLKDSIKSNWNRELDIYNKYRNITVKFIDFLEFYHMKDIDKVHLKLCIVGSSLEKSNDINEEKINYYDLILEKVNGENEHNKNQTNYTSNCPYCGAPTNISTYGECSHCREMVSIYDNVWKIVEVKPS